MNFFARFFLLILIVSVLGGCQGDQDKGATAVTAIKETPVAAPVEQSSANEKTISATLDANVEMTKSQEEDPSAELRQEVNLSVSKRYMGKVAEVGENYLATPPPLKKIASKDSTKVKVSGGVIIDDKEEKTLKKVDGGEVKISIPIN